MSPQRTFRWKRRTRLQMAAVLFAVYRAWRRYPSLRLAQLLVNALPEGDPCPEIFYRDDADLVHDMRTFDPSVFLR